MRIFPECGGLKNSSGHVNSLTRKLNEQRKNGNEDYCDITLTCGGTRFPVHRAILSASSPYFECLLEGHFAERTQNEIDLTESITDPETLECILEFIYTGNLLVEGSNFREVLGASSLLLLNDAIDLLSEYLKNSLVIANCLEIFELAFKYSLESISQLCLHIIQARMHDYFCHGSKILALTPEVFLHLCNQNVFTDTSKQNTSNVIKEYVENLKAAATEVSQETVRELYRIAECHSIANIHSLFGGWLVDNKEPRPKRASKPVDSAKNENQNDELLLIRDKESKNDINLIGWLSKASKWIKLASVNLTSLNCTSLGSFLGFAHDSMTFTSQHEVIMVPLHAGQPRRVGRGCLDGCHSFEEGACPHFHFTAWNDLFCVYPQSDFRSPDEDSWDSDSYDSFYDYDRYSDREKLVILGYRIAKYSFQLNQWHHICDLELPDAYNDLGYDGIDQVLYVSFELSTNGKQVFLMIAGSDKNLITLMQLTKDASGTLKSQEVFHTKEIQIPYNSSQVLVKSTATKLRFHEMSSSQSSWLQQLKKPTFPIRSITEVTLKNKKIQRVPLKAKKFSFPESRCEELRTQRQKINQFATSKQSGLLYYIDNVMPYVAKMWLYDPVKNEWKSLLAPPFDGEISSMEIHPIPVRLLPEIMASPPAIFEDKHDNPKHGPFGQSKSVF